MEFFITFPRKQKEIYQQYTLDMLYNGIPYLEQTTDTAYTHMVTVRTEHQDMFLSLDSFPAYRLFKELLEAGSQVSKSYTTYRIPKASGGFRTITAPNEDLKYYQASLSTVLQQMCCNAHESVYSYVTGRTCKHAIELHKNQNNKWFYKFDIKDFFPSCTRSVLTAALSKVYPFSKMSADEWDKLMIIALFENKLPQGSPLSPLLSNMVLQQFDYYMYYNVKKLGGTYTRYADDMILSFPKKHELSFISSIIKRHLHNVSPAFKLNDEKSRCGSIAGSNWNLGLILNKENKITLGHKRKQKLKAKINNFIYDFTNGNYWSIIDTQVLQGEINYFKQIEPEYAAFVIKRLETKYNTQSLSSMFKQIIHG